MKGSQIQPLFDNVLIEPSDGDQMTAGGIVLPDSAKEKPQMGIVRAVGAGKANGCGGACGCSDDTTKPVVKKGDKVLYKKWGGNEVKVQNKEWMMVEQKDILAIIK